MVISESLRADAVPWAAYAGIDAAMKILLVDDDDLLVGQLTSDLAGQNYVVDTANDGLLGWEYSQAVPYDLIVLDIDLPGLDGVALCQRLRQAGYAGPILLLTGRSSSTDKVRGLNAGADDYLVKPYTLAELTARMRALLRRPPTLNRRSLTWGPLQLDSNTGQVTVAGRPVVLSPKEYGLLELFLRHPDRTFSNTVLLERLWSVDEAPGEETIRTHIKRLRRKIKQAGVDDIVANVYGMGYRLRPAPTGGATEEAPAPAPKGAPSDGAAIAAPSLDQQPARAEAARQAAIAAFERFRPAIDERLAALHQAAAALATHRLPEEVQTAALAAAHKLAGSLGLFGFMEGSHQARRLEDWLQQPNIDQGPAFCALVEQLEQQLQLGPKPEPEPEPEATPEPEARSGAIAVSLPPAAPRSAEDRYQVLAIDDDLAILAHLQRLLPPWGLEVIPLNDSRQTWTSLEASPPDLVLLDLDMPHLGGLDICRRLRQCDRWQTLPILFLTACRESATVYQLYQAGADDYLPKPILEPELINRLFQRLERGRLLQTLAGTDPLTGLANRQKGRIELDLLLHLAQRQGQPFSLVRIEICPTQPPELAKALLRALGQTLPSRLSSGDAIASWSKSEIVVGTLGSDLAAAQAQLRPALTQVLAAAIATAPAPPSGPGLYLGGATFPSDGHSLDDLYRRASQQRTPLRPAQVRRRN